jgi:hypothetical protein
MGLMHMLFWQKNFEDVKCPGPGLPAAPDLINYLCKTNRKISCLRVTEYRTKSQLYSQGKLTMQKSKNSTRKRNLKKQTNGSMRCRNLRSIEWYQKTYVQIS